MHKVKSFAQWLRDRERRRRRGATHRQVASTAVRAEPAVDIETLALGGETAVISSAPVTAPSTVAISAPGLTGS